MRQEQSGKTRKQNFEDYYRAHPEKLNGRSVNEAYAAMQRQATRNSRANAETGHGLNPALAGRQAAIQRRLDNTNKSNSNSVTVGRGFSRTKVPLPSAPTGFGGMKLKPPSLPHIPKRDTKKDQERLDSLSKKMRRNFMP